MEDVLLIGEVGSALAAAIRARGLDLVDRPHPACRVALVTRDDSSSMGLLYLQLVDGDQGVVAALDQGAADAADRADHPAVIAARLSALARRAAAPTMLWLGELSIDRINRRVARAGRPIALLGREYTLLLFLARNAGSLVTRETLRKGVWGLDFDPGTNVIEVHISRLRAKLDRGFADPCCAPKRAGGTGWWQHRRFIQRLRTSRLQDSIAFQNTTDWQRIPAGCIRASTR